MPEPSPPSPAVLDRDGFQHLVAALLEDGYRVLGPTVRDGAISPAEIDGVAHLPEGWGDEQSPAHYRLRRRDDNAWFGYAVGAGSWKRWLFPPRSVLWSASRSDTTFAVHEEPRTPPRYAFIGVRACELAAIAVQDRVFLDGDHPDPIYGTNRDDLFVVAVHCGSPAGTCFCASAGTGPRASGGYDLALTELVDERQHEFVVEVGTRRGELLLARVPHRRASELDVRAARAVTDDAAQRMERTLPRGDLRALLASTLVHPRWDDVAARCLACTNCTLVCPTCFCSAIEDASDLDGAEVRRERRWDSCFTAAHSYLHGGSVHASTRSRYRQWLTHKLGTWWDQFGSSGCVGCGRCITWCPAGIDLTEELHALAVTGEGTHA